MRKYSNKDSGEEENHSNNETTKRQRKRIGLRICSDEENQEEEDIPGDNLKQDTRLFPTEDAIEAEDDKEGIQKMYLGSK